MPNTLAGLGHNYPGLLRSLLGGLLLLLLSGCQEKEPVYQYELADVQAAQQSAEKDQLKSELELIAVAYSDIFGEPIAQEALNRLARSYDAFGDKRFMTDLIIRNFLNEGGTQLPSHESMRTAPEAFVRQAYQQLLVRQPTQYELHYLTEQIRADAQLSPETFYYALLTSDEYRHY
jgi:hypothetical protein